MRELTERLPEHCGGGAGLTAERRVFILWIKLHRDVEALDKINRTRVKTRVLWLVKNFSHWTDARILDCAREFALILRPNSAVPPTAEASPPHPLTAISSAERSSVTATPRALVCACGQEFTNVNRTACGDCTAERHRSILRASLDRRISDARAELGYETTFKSTPTWEE